MIKIVMTQDQYEKLCWAIDEVDLDAYASEDEELSGALDAVRDAEEIDPEEG